MSARTWFAAIALAIALVPAVAAAQPHDAPPAVRRERIKERVLALRAATLTRELQLDEATAVRLFPVLARHDEQLARLARDAAVLRRTANDAAARGDNRAVDRAIDELVAN